MGGIVTPPQHEAIRPSSSIGYRMDPLGLFRAMFLRAPVGCALLDGSSQILQANMEMSRILGQEPGTLKGLHLFGTRAMGDAGPLKSGFAEMVEGRRSSLKADVCLGGPRGEWFRASVQAMEDSVSGGRYYVLVLTEITDIVQLQEHLKALSLVDELTGLFNRRGFNLLGTKRLMHANRTGRGLLVLFADIDGMKWINDNLGHHCGDEALREFAGLLNATLRRSDVAARIGGDEFAAITLDVENGTQKRVVERLRSALAELNARPGRKYRLSCSIGGARYDPKAPVSLDDLLREADRRMYEHKRSKGRDSGLQVKQE